MYTKRIFSHVINKNISFLTRNWQKLITYINISDVYFYKIEQNKNFKNNYGTYLINIKMTSAFPNMPVVIKITYKTPRK